MSVGKICTRTVATAVPSETVLEVARRMGEFNVGTLVVVEEGPLPVGFITDRDIVLRCVARDMAPAETQISEIMTRGVRTVYESTPIEEALRTMAGAAMRRLVVTGDGGALVGLLSLDDVLELLTEEAAAVGQLLRKEAPEMVSR